MKSVSDFSRFGYNIDLVGILAKLNSKEKIALIRVLIGSILSMILEILAFIVFLVLTSFLVSKIGGLEISGIRKIFLEKLTFYTHDNQQVISLLVVQITIIFLSKNFWGYRNLKRLTDVAMEIQKRLGNELYQRFFSLKYLKIKSLDTIETSSALVDNLNHAVSGQIISILWACIELLNILTILLILATQNLIITVIFVFFCATLLIISYSILKNKAQGNGAKLYSSTISSRKQFSQGKESISILRLGGKLDYFYEKLNIDRATFTYTFLRSLVLQQLPKYLIESYLILAVLVLYGIIQLANAGQSSTEFLLMFILAGFRLLPAVTRLQSIWIGYSDSSHRRESFYKIYNEIMNPELNDFEFSVKREFMPTGLKLEKISGSNVCFRHDSKVILNNISFEIHSGEPVLIKGPSGVGKTTLLTIIAGLVNPTSGEVIFHLNNGKKYMASAFPYAIGYAPQHPILFKGNLINNVLLTDDGSAQNQELVRHALTFVDTNKVWEKMSVFENFIMLGGMNLSGGERQRLNIARAIATADLQILDEPTNSLDSKSSAEIIKNLILNSVKNGLFLITTTHQEELHNMFSSTIQLSEEKVEK